MLEIPEGQEHTVYLLGAGFSAERGIPMMDGFVTRMIEANGWLRSDGRTAESDDIIKLLKYRHDISSAALRCVIRPDNIEDLLSAAAAEPSDQYQGLDRCIRRSIAATIDYTEKQAIEPKQIGLVLGNTDFNSEKIPPLWKSIESSTYEASAKAVKVPAYDFYVAAMTDRLYDRRSGKHTLISYNYDLLLERSLRSMGIPMSYGFSEDELLSDDREGGFVDDSEINWNLRLGACTNDCVQILKMHGSMNWYLEYRQHHSKSGQTQPVLSVREEYEPDCADELFIQPPTWQKRQNSRDGNGKEGGLVSLWSNAIKALSTATKIVVIGYSFPITDYYVKSMFQIGLKSNIGLGKIIIVNPSLDPDKRDGKEREDYLSRMRVIFNEQLFESGVVTLISMSTRDALQGSNNAPMIVTPGNHRLFQILNPQAHNRPSPFLYAEA